MARHAARICLGWCTPPSRASLTMQEAAASPQHVVACFTGRRAACLPRSHSPACDWHTSSAARCLMLAGRAAAHRLSTAGCPAQEAEAVHRRRQGEAAAAARHAAVEEAARRRAEQERLRQSFAEVRPHLMAQQNNVAGQACLQCSMCEAGCCRKRSANSKRQYCRPSGDHRCSKCWRSGEGRNRQLWRPRGARDGRRALHPSASG